MASTVDRQIVAGLDQLHREMVGAGQCRWAYDGRVVISRVEGFNRYTITSDS